MVVSVDRGTGGECFSFSVGPELSRDRALQPYSPTALHLNEFVCRILLKQHQQISGRSLTQKMSRFATIRQEISVKIALK